MVTLGVLGTVVSAGSVALTVLLFPEGFPEGSTACTENEYSLYGNRFPTKVAVVEDCGTVIV
jgi:hypothetical protein